jgi:excisionase family DNA binding protein
MTAESWVTLAEIAQHLQVREETVHRWIRGKNMPAHRVGRVWRFKASEVDAWVCSGEAGSDGNLTEEAN